MGRHRVILFAMSVLLLMVLGQGVAMAPAHVSADEFQVSHNDKVKHVKANALIAHLRHGDIELPACDFNNIFLEKSDSSNVVSADFTGVTYSDIGFVPRADAGGLTPACPPGKF